MIIKRHVYSLTPNEAVAKRIVKLLREKKMSKYRLEQKGGLTHGSLEAILNGHNKTVTLTTIYRLARGFEIDILEFLDDEVFRSNKVEID